MDGTPKSCIYSIDAFSMKYINQPPSGNPSGLWKPRNGYDDRGLVLVHCAKCHEGCTLARELVVPSFIGTGRT